MDNEAYDAYQNSEVSALKRMRTTGRTRQELRASIEELFAEETSAPDTPVEEKVEEDK